MKMPNYSVAANMITVNTVDLRPIHFKSFLGTNLLFISWKKKCNFFFFDCRNNFQYNQDISLFHKLSITSKYFETHVVPNSHATPYILMFYADWCFACMKTANAFMKMIETLEPLGITFATVNAGHEEMLLRKTGVHSLPCIVLVLNGHNYVYRENVFSVQKMVDFIRAKLPYKLIQPVRDDGVRQFLDGWDDNRIRGLIMEPRAQPRLRYLITAFRYKQRVAFG